LAWLALAYNPQLVGPLPDGFTTSKLYAWSGHFQTYNNAASVATTASYGNAPTYGSGLLYGTSIGLDRPLVDMLREVQAALDPTNTSTLAASWGSTHLQPCAPWKSLGSNNVGQASTSLAFGRAWTGVMCQDTVAMNLGVSPTSMGGVGDLVLFNMSLQGTLPVQLRELRTASTISLALNALSGTIPNCWCVHATRAMLSVPAAIFAHAFHARHPPAVHVRAAALALPRV
jgi:hypothetical protein